MYVKCDNWQNKVCPFRPKQNQGKRQLNSKSRLFFVFINQKILLKRAVPADQSDISTLNSLADLMSLPAELAEYAEQQQSLVMSSQYGQHWLIDIHHLDFEHEEYKLFSMRELLASLPAEDFQYITQAWQYALFLRTHRYCGRCGAAMRKVTWEMAMHCDKCSHRVYPRVSPCIIVAIHNGSQILLAQGPRQAGAGFYSTLAGFVESAESLEQAVHREVMEEVSVSVKNIDYFSSQPWPFPHSLMVGYIAEYNGGDIKVDGKEIHDAQWFNIDNLPNTPPKVSIAGQLIEETLRRIKKSDKI
ncbi:MAG: NAD+ diphosphatase [Alphaproteobacteria bacterium]|jgi:NAD+ diphosphatase